MSKFQVPEIQTKFGDVELYDYQCYAVGEIISHCRKSIEPAYVYASVSAGKSLLIAAVANHFQRVNQAAVMQGFEANHQVLMLVRTGDLVKQNSEEAWSIRCKNSIWCAGLSSKSTTYPCVMGSEKSVYNALRKELKKFKPTIVLIDECHMLDYENEETQMMAMLEEFKRRNKNLRVIGLTGSPWRNRDGIKGNFWKEELVSISRDYLTKRGFVMPVEFGFGTGDAHYESSLDNFNPDEEGNNDLTKSQLEELENKILNEGTKTHQIMLDVMKTMKNRNCALITCCGRKHCEDAAKYLPNGSYAIVDQSTTTKERLEIKDKCNKGLIKYVLQIGCWTVGVSIPRIDTIVIMRMIGSMTLYEQLVGRGVRLLKQHDKDAGIIKNECLVMDYTDTSSIMAALFDSDELGQAENSRAKANDEEMMECPKCAEPNSLRARRCCGTGQDGYRCDHFFSFKTCSDMYDTRTNILMKKGCSVQNDPASRVCRGCGGFMKDPNEQLLNTAYTNEDFINVLDFNFGMTRAADKLIAQYTLANGKKAREVFDISKREKWRLATWKKFVSDHVKDKEIAKKLIASKEPKQAMQYASYIKVPMQVTHRKNDKGFDLLARKLFQE